MPQIHWSTWLVKETMHFVEGPVVSSIVLLPGGLITMPIIYDAVEGLLRNENVDDSNITNQTDMYE